MPELPEVEAARRAIADNCIGKKIKRSVVADDVKVIDGVSRSDLEASLTGKTIVGAHRKGKHMWIQLDSPPFPSFHFGLSGELYIKGIAVTKYKRSAVKDTDEWPSKYSKLFLELDDGLELSFTDKIRFARVRLFKNPAIVPPILELGPDALLEPMTEDELFKELRKRKTSIKALLLNQSFISGIGNWIADEVLYQAKIHPLQSAASIPKESCTALHKSLKEVIEYSVEVDADYSLLPADWLCHSRWGKKPGKINGKTIKFITAGGRTSAYVPALQKLSGDQAVKAALLLKQQKKSSNKKNDVEADSESEEISDSEEIAKNAKSKRVKKTTKSRAKKPPAKRKSDSSDDDDESESEDDSESQEIAKNAKSRRVQKTTKSRAKKPTAKRKPNTSDDGDDEKKTAKRKKSNDSSGIKKSATRKKSHGSESDNGDGVDDDHDDHEDEDEVKGKHEVAKKVQIGKRTRKMAK